MSDILVGLKGDDWERGLLITRHRGRGMPRVVDDKENLNIILANRVDAPKMIEPLREFLLAEYNMNASKRNARAALQLQRFESNERIIAKIKAQFEASPIPDSVQVIELLKNELSWIEDRDKVRITTQALERMGYIRKRWENGALWIRQRS